MHDLGLGDLALLGRLVGRAIEHGCQARLEHLEDVVRHGDLEAERQGRRFIIAMILGAARVAGDRGGGLLGQLEHGSSSSSSVVDSASTAAPGLGFFFGPRYRTSSRSLSLNTNVTPYSSMQWSMISSIHWE